MAREIPRWRRALLTRRGAPDPSSVTARRGRGVSFVLSSDFDSASRAFGRRAGPTHDKDE